VSQNIRFMKVSANSDMIRGTIDTVFSERPVEITK